MDYFTGELKKKIEDAKRNLRELQKQMAYHKEFLKRKPQLEDELDVHTAHCCEYHKSCKYGDADCTVATGKKHASYPCNCDW